MATNMDLLNQTLTNLITQLEAITLNPKVSYSVDGQSVSWTEYNRLLLDMIAAVRQQIQIEGGPVWVSTSAWAN